MEGVRRRLTLSDQMSILDASNLRDLLRIRDDEDGDGRNALAGLTLGAVLGCEEIIRPNPFQQQQQQQQPSRTLLDIIKDEESGAVYREINVDNTNNNNNNDNNKQKSWKSFKDRLCLRRAGAAWSSSSSSNHHHHPVSDCDFSPDDCRMEISGPSLTGFQRSSFSLISRTSVSTTAPVENVTDFDERESTTIEENNAISSDVTESTNIAPSEPVVMRLSTALAAEREEQRQAASSETQLEERESTDQSQLEEERESTVEVAEQEGDQRGVNVVSIGQQQQEQPLRVSLMALLEETMDHRQSEMILLDEEEEEEEEGMEGGEEVVVAERQRGGRKEEYICCVCMVRHKGAAFIPCGHTFCRLCSRKLWVNRGNCPLCNGFILEILDIF